jgi:hypothetical protein
MNPTGRLPGNSVARLFESQLAPYVDAFGNYLNKRRYASSTVDGYLACIAEFELWMNRSLLDIDRIDDEVVQRFLDSQMVGRSNPVAERSKYCNSRTSLSHSRCAACARPGRKLQTERRLSSLRTLQVRLASRRVFQRG